MSYDASIPPALAHTPDDTPLTLSAVVELINNEYDERYLGELCRRGTIRANQQKPGAPWITTAGAVKAYYRSRRPPGRPRG